MVIWRSAKPFTQVRILYSPQHGGRSLMVGRKFVALYVRVRFSPVTPKERWVSGLNQQFTKLPAQKVREFESHSFRKCPYGGIGIRNSLRSYKLQVRLLLRVQKQKMNI